MNARTAITVHRDQEELRRLWESPELRSELIRELDARVTFKDAPGDRGTEIHVDLGDGGRGIGAIAQKLTGSDRLAKVRDELRHFKQRVEAGEIARSDGTPEGERAARKLKQRPAQPLDESEREKVGV
jgi:uncharacterized membrane protein